MAIQLDTMKFVDRYAGVFICWILSTWRRLRLRFRKTPSSAGYTLQKVLFVELSEMGSMVAAYPVMQDFRDRHPDAEFYFLTFKQNRACLDVLKLIPPENVLTLETTSLVIFARTMLGAIRRLRRLRLDAVIDFELFSRISAILSYMAGARFSAGFNRVNMEGLYRGTLHTHPVGYNHYTHISRNFLALLRVLEGGTDEAALLKEQLPSPALPLAHPHLDELRRTEIWNQLRSLCPELRAESRLVILNPNAGNLLPIRAWPLQNYIELTRRLLQQPDICVLVMGTAEATGDAERMCRELPSPRLINFTEATEFEDLIPLFSLADLLITNDSGPAHFASLTDTAILVFFGPETPDLYRPLSQKADVFYSSYHCSPCLTAYNHRTTRCTNNRCLQCITVDEVEAKARQSLERYRVTPRP